MNEAEFFERFDRHLERNTDVLERVDVHLERNTGVLERVEREMALTREEVQRSREAHQDLRAFTREITTRNEKIWREVSESLADMRDGIRANTQAVLKALDRVEGNGAGA